MQSSTPAISVRNLSKCYRLGTIGRHTLVEEVEHWWHKLRGRDPRKEMGRIGPGTATEQRRIETEAAGEDRFWALKDVSLDIQPGEIVGIIGRNGAGKSTLLKILSRITEPTEGEAFINGRVGSLLEVGTGFHPELTGRENIYMNGAILGMRRSEIDARIDEIIAFSELSRFVDTPVKRYSSGMYVRLAFAVAAHLEPEVMLVDEVLAVGDAAFQRKCLSKMEGAARSGRTILFVSHNMPAVSRLCTRGILLQGGRLVADGPADEVVATYLRHASDTGERRTWDEASAPGSEIVRLLDVAVTRRDGKPLLLPTVNDELAVRLTYRTGSLDASFRCMVWFSTAGTIAFATVEPKEFIRRGSGLYTSVVHIPAHLLAEQEYSLSVSIFSSHGKKLHHVRERNVLAFQVVDPVHGDSARGDYVEGFGGVLRPRLEWDFTEESNLETSTP